MRALRLMEGWGHRRRTNENGAFSIVPKAPWFGERCCGSHEVTEDDEDAGGEQGRDRQGKDPGEGDIADGGKLESAAVGHHGAGYTRREDVGRGDGQVVLVGGDDGDGSNDFSGCALRVGQVLLTDFLADRDDDALPAHHGAESEC